MTENTNAIPIFEAKNRLPFYIRQAENGAPVKIMRHNKVVAYLVSKEDFEQAAAPKEKSIVEKLQESRKEYGLEYDDFDYTSYFDGVRETSCYGRQDSDHVFDEV